MMRIFFIMIAIMIKLSAFENHKIEPDFVKDGDYMGIKILDSKVLSFNKIDGLKFCEISDIAYDTDHDTLYALSDRGGMFKFDIALRDKKIVSLKPLWGKNLRDKKGNKLSKTNRDSEGMHLSGEDILISFERKPRVTLFDKEMKMKEDLKLPLVLAFAGNYQGWGNDALESLTFSQKYGIITASEYPLKGQKKGYHDIYNQKGKICSIKKDPKQAIVEMEMMDDESLLLLQRAYSFRTISMQTTLKKVYLDKKNEGVCASEILAWMSTREGWDIDNFEGLTQVSKNTFLMVSDDNNNFFQKTILTLFKVK